MELDENNVPEVQDDDYVEIYSRNAILGFSIFPSPIFGSVLLILNLIAAGYRKAVLGVVVFTILFVVAENLSLNFFFTMPKVIDPKHLDPQFFVLAGIMFLINIIGGLILTFYFFKKYFPENDYYPRSIISPMIVLVVLILLSNLFH